MIQEARETTTFVSHAQNFEDVMLWRALGHVEGGFYVDVGAWSPDKDSVTRAFYERGWRGINLEPNLEWQAELNAKRPEDINLPLAISDAPGEERFWVFANLGLSTMDEAVAKAHMAEGWTAEPGVVPVTTLNALWETHVGDRPVHFLKVDVEGLEERVLRGNDWRRHRPWLVVVESTRPMSQEETHETWEPILTGADYALAYHDGLNRYYVAAEHAELRPALEHPPNVFDRFKLAGHHEAEQRATHAEAHAAEQQAHAEAAGIRAANAEVQAVEAQQRSAEARSAAEAADVLARAAAAQATAADARAAESEARAREAEARAAAAEARAAEAEARAHELQTRLEGLYNSRSWRITRPLRWAMRPFRTLPPSS